MKLQVRKGVFETNSSSVHCMTMCSQSDYDKWKNGELFYYKYNNQLVTKEEMQKILEETSFSDKDDFLSYSEFWDYCNEYETFKDSFNDVVAFGYYGYD